MILGRPASIAKAAVAALVLTATPLSALADAAGPYYERAFVVAAQDKCRLFAADTASALSASMLQARGAAEAGGVGRADLALTAERARARAAGVACDDPELKVVQGRVQAAYAGWSSTRLSDFAGGWKADRGRAAPWRLVQDARMAASDVRMGLTGAGDANRLTVAVAFAGKNRPYAARLVLRDAARLDRPWLPTERAALPAEAMRTAVLAAGGDDADAALLPAKARDGQAWTFGPQAAEAVAALDPREVYVVEFLFRDDSVARVAFHVGDFAAARAFTGMGTL